MFGFLQGSVLFIITIVCFATEVVALISAARHQPGAFTAAGKRTKNFWVILLGATAVIGFLGLQPPLGRGYLGLGALFVAVPAFIYFADVAPALGHRGRGSNRGNRNNRSGW